jgi:hypothetical protein
MRQLYAETQAKADTRADSPGPSQVRSGGRINDSIAEVLETDDDLQAFHKLRQKALRSATEQQEYLAMISDKELIMHARRDLLTAMASAKLDQHDELKRLLRIQFLNSALAWRENPERARAVEAASAVIMADLPGDAANDLKGSMLGDKFDLFQLLLDTDLEHAKSLLAEVRGTPSEKILQFAWRSSRVGQSEPVPAP